jgi:hypothetical protein
MRIFVTLLFTYLLGACAVNFESAMDSPTLVQTTVTKMSIEDAVNLGRNKLATCLEVGSEGKFMSGSTYVNTGPLGSIAERKIENRIDQAVYGNAGTTIVLSYEATESGTQVTAYSNAWGMNKWAKRAVLWFGETDIGCRP